MRRATTWTITTEDGHLDTVHDVTEAVDYLSTAWDGHDDPTLDVHYCDGDEHVKSVRSESGTGGEAIVRLADTRKWNVHNWLAAVGHKYTEEKTGTEKFITVVAS